MQAEDAPEDERGEWEMKMLPTRQLFWIPFAAVFVISYALVIYQLQILRQDVRYMEVVHRATTNGLARSIRMKMERKASER